MSLSGRAPINVFLLDGTEAFRLEKSTNSTASLTMGIEFTNWALSKSQSYVSAFKVRVGYFYAPDVNIEVYIEDLDDYNSELGEFNLNYAGNHTISQQHLFLNLSVAFGFRELK